jgi:DNA polymerase bacteriophage-type
MLTCFNDTEVRSSTPIKQGTHAFLADPEARLLLVTWKDPYDPDAPNADPDAHATRAWQPAAEPCPRELIEILNDPGIIKKAHNSQFDFNAYQYLLPRHGVALKPSYTVESWQCLMVEALGRSLPAGLDMLGQVLGLTEEQKKLADGKKLIRLFCVPQTERKTGRKYWADHNSHPEEWARFVDYGLQDVDSMCHIDKRLRRYRPDEREWQLWRMDQRINLRGLPIDGHILEGALSVAAREKKRLAKRMKMLTGLDNPNSITQLNDWLEEQLVFIPDMTKHHVAESLKREDLPDDVREVLQCRQEAAKTSTSKYAALLGAVSADGRLRGAFQFRGASRTGRYAGRVFQPHNLPRGSLKVDLSKGIDDMTPMVDLLRHGDPADDISWIHGKPMEVLKSCIRAVVRAPEGHSLHVSDLNAIENRVIGYVAGCEPTLDVFRNGLDPYKSFGARMYKKPYEEITGQERTDSKPAVLGCGFMLGGGDWKLDKKTGLMQRTGLWGYAHSMGIPLTKEQAHESVEVFRKVFPDIVELWYALDDAFRSAIGANRAYRVNMLTLRWEKPFVTIELPSGRKLYYCSPRIDMCIPPWEEDKEKPKPRPTLTYNQVGMNNRWQRISTHPGKLVENCVQAIANDVLNEGLWRAEQGLGVPEPYEIVGHVHDEGIGLVPDTSPLTIEHLNACLAHPVPWAPDLPLAAHGFVTQYYRKD